MKKVDEGVELFDEIWEKVYSAEQQNQKEKYEMDLKKEIKKLQRLRDQIKSWIGSSDVKDKDPLIDARKLIETKMEAFKYCEKETKTKTYSKEGLAKAEKLTPEEEAKKATCEWITEIIEKLTQMAEEKDLEVERLGAGRGKKTNKNLIEECNHFLSMHRFHLTKLEGIMRLVNNDVLDVEVVDPIKEDLEYYIDSYDDDDYLQAYDEDFFYEALGLDTLQVVNVDRVTQASAEKEKSKKDPYSDLASSSSKGSEKGSKKSKKASASSMIPLTIGRARKGKKSTRATSTSSSKASRAAASDSPNDASNSGDDDSSNGNTPTKGRRGMVGVPTPTTIPAASTGTSSMAAILKRETEQQEKERAQKVSKKNRVFCRCCVAIGRETKFFSLFLCVFLTCLFLFLFQLLIRRRNNSAFSSSNNSSNRQPSERSNSKRRCFGNNRRLSFGSNKPRRQPSNRQSRNNKPSSRPRCGNSRRPRCVNNNFSNRRLLSSNRTDYQPSRKTRVVLPLVWTLSRDSTACPWASRTAGAAAGLRRLDLLDREATTEEEQAAKPRFFPEAETVAPTAAFCRNPLQPFHRRTSMTELTLDPARMRHRIRTRQHQRPSHLFQTRSSRIQRFLKSSEPMPSFTFSIISREPISSIWQLGSSRSNLGDSTKST